MKPRKQSTVAEAKLPSEPDELYDMRVAKEMHKIWRRKSKELRLRQQAFADEIGVNQSSVARFLNGKHEVRIPFWFKLCFAEILKVPVRLFDPRLEDTITIYAGCLKKLERASFRRRNVPVVMRLGLKGCEMLTGKTKVTAVVAENLADDVIALENGIGDLPGMPVPGYFIVSSAPIITDKQAIALTNDGRFFLGKVSAQTEKKIVIDNELLLKDDLLYFFKFINYTEADND